MVESTVSQIMSQKWYDWVDSRRGVAILDGGLGYILEERGNDLSVSPMWSGRFLISNSNELCTVAHLWLQAGADIISTATYQATVDSLCKEANVSRRQAERLMASSIELLDDVRKQFWKTQNTSTRQHRRYPMIAGSFGPYSAVLADVDEYSGQYNGISLEDMVQFHKERALILSNYTTEHGTKCDILCFETIGNDIEARAIAETMQDAALVSTPYWVSFQCRTAEQIANGVALSDAVDLVLNNSGENLIAIGVNCVKPAETPRMVGIIKSRVQTHMAQIGGGWRVDTVAYPGSGEVYGAGGWKWTEQKLDEHMWAEVVMASDAGIVGGCCRIGENHIRALLAARRTGR